MKRRTFIKAVPVAVPLITAMASCNKAVATSLTPMLNGEFVLPNLNFAYDALVPHIDAKTMEIHHSKHHGGYVKNLNAAVVTDAPGKTIEELLTNISKYSAAIRNNGGGHWNHSFFWQLLSPDGAKTQPNEKLLKAINSSFGSFDAFKKEFGDAAAKRFGSGWAWLCKDDNDKLFVSSTPNQDNPLMDVADKKGTPIIALDVWEHAYYLNYQNKRADYISAFWNVLNWDAVKY